MLSGDLFGYSNGSLHNEGEVTKEKKNEAFDETDKTGIRRSRSSHFGEGKVHTTIESSPPHSSDCYTALTALENPPMRVLESAGGV